MKNTARCIAATVLCLASLVGLSGCAAGDYSKAGALSKSGRYEEAGRIYLSLGDYRDSEELAKECTYLQALDALSAKDYETAEQLFASVGVYKDAPARLEQAREGRILAQIAGKWVSERKDLSDGAAERALELLGPSAGKILDDYLGGQSSLSCVVTVTIDGRSAELGFDEESFEDSAARFESALLEALPYAAEQIYKQIAADRGMSLEELEKAVNADDLEELFTVDTGMSYAEYARLASGRDALLAELSAFCGTAEVSVRDGAIVFRTAGGELLAAYDADGDTFTLFTAGGDGEDGLVFRRA